MSRSAALMLIANHDSPQEAIDWLKTVRIDATDLDPDGKRFLLGCQLELADWEAAQKSLDAVTDDDLRAAPVLHHMVAITHLLKAVPAELRAIVRDQPPFEAAEFPLDSGSAGIEARRLAHRSFIDAAEAARQLGCPLAERIDDEYALWLELTDPDKCAEGRMRLESKLRGPKIDLCLVRFGLQFGIELDNKLVEQEIERQIALNGEITFDAALARFALAFKQKTPEDDVNYIIRYHNELAGHIDKKMILSLQIELFSQIGQLDKANECLGILLEEGLSETEESRLRIIISRAEGTDPVEALKEQFQKTGSLSDLGILVDELEARNDWSGICEYGKILFDRIHERRDAERLAIALHNTQERERLVEFLELNKTLLPKSNQLRLIHCWSLYHEGKLLEARSELAKLGDDWDNENYRTLQIDLAVSIGDWNSLSVFIAKECNEKDKRNAKELITAARLALHLGSIPHAKDLIFAAAERGKDDANVLGSAYFLAASAGLEDDPEVAQWIQKATVLSGEDGPLQMMTLSDLLDKKPEWDRQASEIWEMLIRNELPMFLAAQSLNKSLSDLMLFPALANPSESDPRCRGIIPAYSGQRQSLSFDTDRQIGIDATALLTLSFLDLLDETLDAFDTVHIPHSTLGWLFDEKKRVAFHQPSRIRDAAQISRLLTNGVLEKLSPSTVPNSDLSAQVGEELALFIAEATTERREDDSQHIIVQPSPVHLIGSLMEEEADLTAYATVLSSCQSIVDKLQKGRIMANEERKARAYLQFHEKPWPNQPEIADGATLYLDDLAINHFLHIGILEKLRDAGFRLIISSTKESETNQLLSYENTSSKSKDTIERIRSAVNSRIESKKIKASRLTNADPSTDRSISEHPTAGVFSLTKDCNAIVTDDRFLNQHANFGAGDSFVPIFSTLDLIDMLVSTGSKTNEERMEYRTRLRQAGYIFVPVSEDELAHHLKTSTVEDDKIVETAELKAIRENLLCVRMRTWLQLPKEAPWLNTSLIAFIRVMKSLWKAGADFSSVRVRSNWIMNQIDVRGWAHCFDKESGDNIVKTGRGAYILLVLTPPDDVPQQVKGEYWSWVEEMVLTPIKEQYPDLYYWIVEEQRRLIARAADMDITDEEAT